MADSRHITRRAALVGAATGAVAFAVPATARPEPKQTFDIGNWLETAPANAVAQYHLTELTRTMRKMKPGRYVARFDRFGGASIVFDANGADEAWIGWDI